MRSPTRRLLDEAKTEKDVENAYRAEIAQCLPNAKITSPFGSDGFVEFETVRLLLEAKYDWDMKHKTDSCKALGQLVFYLKKFEKAGLVLPNVLFVGDKNECFVLGTSSVQKFLDMKINWDSAPSAGDPELTRALVEDTDIAPFVFNVDETLDFKEVIEQIRALAEGKIRRVRATPESIGVMFAYWQKEVFAGSGLTPVDQVDVFLKCLFGGAYLHPTKKMLIVEGRADGIPINVGLYKSFFSHFEQGYKPSEVETFYAQKDRLIEDDARRRQGAYYTPRIWTEEAHKMITEVLGKDWKDECIVWDPACGTGNLTRDYVFKDLILSTAEKPDVEVIRSQGYNPGAEVFAYDFLNDDDSPFFEGKNVIPDAVHERLEKASKAGKRLVFLMNPPYGTANNTGANGTHKAGIALTTTNEQMKSCCGAASQQLYAQFMYRCWALSDEYGFHKVTVATYSAPTFMSSGSYRKFRDFWYRRFAFRDGMLFQASHFADVSDAWGISFTIWNDGKTDSKTNLNLTLKDVQNFAIVNLDGKAVYNSDDKEASEWVRREIKTFKGLDSPQMSSGLGTKEGSGCRGTLVPGSLGYFSNNANNLSDSGSFVFLTSSTSSRSHGCSCLPTNFLKVCALYAARKLVESTWATQKDEYLAPMPAVEASDEYEQWNADACVFAIADPKNNCTSMRQVLYKGKKWNLSNHFFWMTHKEALAALDTKTTPEIQKDCKYHPAKDVFGNPVVSTPDPYLASILPSLLPLLSPEAKTVLAALKALWLKSLPMRETYSQEHPELHLGSWDSSCYQLKSLWRDLYKEDWEELRGLHKALANKLRPGVYDLGWLRR